VELRAVGADPLRRASQARARLREPPKPSRPLSATVAPGAPMTRFRFRATSWLHAPWGSCRIHPRSQGRDHASGLERHVHDPDTLPSYRQSRARGPRTSRVPEPAPLRMRSRRGLRASPVPGLVSVVRRLAPWLTHRCRSSSAAADARHCAACVSFELGRACPRCAW